MPFRTTDPGRFSLNPAAQAGQGAFGAVPGPLGLPSPAADLAAQYPNLAGTNAAVSNDILAKLGGQVSPGTMNALKLAAAQFGVGSGMPLSGLSQNQLFGNIAGFAEKQAQEGLQDYASLIPTISRTQTVSPETQIAVAEQNALNAAAPDPTAAASYAMELFDKYLAQMGAKGGAATTGGGQRITPPNLGTSWAGGGTSPNLGIGGFSSGGPSGGTLTYSGPTQTAYQNWEQWRQSLPVSGAQTPSPFQAGDFEAMFGGDQGPTFDQNMGTKWGYPDTTEFQPGDFELLFGD